MVAGVCVSLTRDEKKTQKDRAFRLWRQLKDAHSPIALVSLLSAFVYFYSSHSCHSAASRFAHALSFEMAASKLLAPNFGVAASPLRK